MTQLGEGWSKSRSALLVIAASALLMVQSSSAWGRDSSPGLYDLTGWNGAYADTGMPDSAGGTGVSIDVDGQVGYPLYVRGPQASCRPGPHWSAQSYVETGTLPPGIAMNYQGEPGTLGGIPTERGHWIVRMRISNIQCNGYNYRGFNQEVRFHITGSGQVIQ